MKEEPMISQRAAFSNHNTLKVIERGLCLATTPHAMVAQRQAQKGIAPEILVVQIGAQVV
jgi:hypothetical protein